MRFPRWTDIALLPLFLLLALRPARCCAQADAPEILSKAARDDVFARGAVSFPGAIVGFHGIEFANLVGYRPLELDLYKSAQRGSKQPLVIWVHGGGWSRGDARAYRVPTRIGRRFWLRLRHAAMWLPRSTIA